MERKHILVLAALSIALTGCNRHPKAAAPRGDTAELADADAVDTAAVMSQLTAYLDQNWSDMNSDKCTRVLVPQSLTIRDKRVASNGDLELQADVTFMVTNPGNIPGFRGDNPDFIVTHDLKIFEDGCIPRRLTQQFGLGNRDLFVSPVTFGQQITATGTTVTLSKWASGYKVSGFKFQ